MNEMTRVATNGSWVTMIMKTSAGINGARRAQAAPRRATPAPGGGAATRPPVFSATDVMAAFPPSPCPPGARRQGRHAVRPGAAGCVRSWPSPVRAGLIPLGHVVGQPLTSFQRRLHAHLPGDGRADVLRHLGAQ